jgi:hypothetical protein
MPIIPSLSPLEIPKMPKTTSPTPSPKQYRFGHLFLKIKKLKEKEIKK